MNSRVASRRRLLVLAAPYAMARTTPTDGLMSVTSRLISPTGVVRRIRAGDLMWRRVSARTRSMERP